MNPGGKEAGSIADGMAATFVKVEEILDENLERLNNMGEGDIEKIRRNRLKELRAAQKIKQENLSNGHGRYMELPDQPAFFEATKKSKWLAVHFYRPTTQRCQIVNGHLERLAQKHLETRFCKIDAEKCPYLTEKLNIFVMPTILLIAAGKTLHQIRGFDELGGTDDFHEDALAYVMSQTGILNFDGGPPAHLTEAASVNSIALRRMNKSRTKAHARDGDEVDDY